MSIRLKLIIMFLAIALIPLLFVSVLTYRNYKNSLESNHLSQLQNLAAFKAERIEAYFAGLKADMKIAQGLYNIKRNLPVLTRLARDPNNPKSLAARKKLNEQLLHMQSISGLSDIMLVNPEGMAIYASKPVHYLKDLSKGSDAEQEAFSQGRENIYFSDVYYDKDEDNRLEILLTAPVSDFNDDFIGVIVFEVDMTLVHKLLQDATGLGKTGEVIVGEKVGNEVIFLNPLRHEPNTIMKRINIGEEAGGPIQDAIQGRSGTGQLIDYRGEKVIAAWRYIPSLDWGMVAKIDAKEAFADVTNLRNLMVIILAMIIVLSGVMAISIAQSISEPIKQLSKGAEIIGRGNLDYRVGTNLKDEIGQLSRSFDKMTADLKQTTASRNELSIEVRERKEAETALRASETRYRRLFEAAQDGIIILDADSGQIVDVNPFIKKILGYSHEELLDKKIWDIGIFKNIAASKEAFLTLQSEGYIRYEDLPLQTKDGRRIEVEFISNMYLVDHKKVIQCNIRDITEGVQARKALVGSQKDLSRAQAVAHTGSWRLDVQRNELTWSDEAYNIFGIPKGTPLTYESFLERVHPEDRKYVNVKWREALRGKGYDIEHRIIADGQIKWVRERAELEFEKDGTLLGGFGTVTDITRRKQMEDELREAKYGLEIRVKERTSQLTETVTALRQSEERYRSLTAATTQIIWTTNASGEVVDDIPSWREFTGQSFEEIKGWGWIDALHPDDREGTARIWSDSVKNRTLYETEYRMRRCDGEYRNMFVRGVPVLEEDGSVREWVGTCTDITEQERAESRQNVTKSLLELFAREDSRKAYLDSAVKIVRDWSGCEFVGIRIRDDKGNIPYESYVGFDNDFLALENALNLDRDNCLCIRTILEKPEKQEQKFITDGGSFYCNDSEAFFNSLTEKQRKKNRDNCVKWGFKSISVVPIRYRDKVMGAIHIADFRKDKVLLPKIQFIETTITPLIGEAVQRFKAEEELEKYRQHLEDEVKSRTEDLARSNRDLEQFAYVASHDLQEPLRAVSGFVGLLRTQLRDSLDAKKLEYMNFATSGVERMQALISGLLEYSRVGTGGKQPEQTDSNAALGRAIAHLGGGIKEFGAKISSDNLPTVYVDPVQLSQVFQNLIGNAIKFCNNEAPLVHISASRQDREWRFAVADNGIGIEPQYTERIFQIFQRLHSREKYPGTGMGLSLCKKIVERHGGRIWVESTAGAGSTFYFTIPDKKEDV